MNNQKKTLLAVLAHPDDETFGMGGSLALYSSQGVDVHLVCATKGEEGDVSSDFMQGFNSIAERRESELMCAAEKLGLASVNFLGYRDSGMVGTDANKNPECLCATPIEEVTENIVKYIRKIRPQVVITFDPTGGYFHPDHIAISKAAVAAFHAAGDTSQFPDRGEAFVPDKLYFSIFPQTFLRLAVRALKLVGRDPTKFGRNKDIDLEMIAGGANYPVNARINYRKVKPRKDAADRCHASQMDFEDAGLLFKFSNYFLSGKDYYMRAHPEPNGMRRVSDLFQD